jgi:CheY-like chemotaxis protein
VDLLELNLLDMSGFEVPRLLRGQAEGHELRLIALTPSREHAGRELPRMAGFERYLLKPVVADELAGLFPVTAAEKPIQGKIGDSAGPAGDLRQRHSSFGLSKTARANHRRDPARLCTPPHRAAGS